MSKIDINYFLSATATWKESMMQNYDKQFGAGENNPTATANTSNTKTLREAAKLALTAMEESEEYGQYLPVGAIDTLREALAAQDKQDETRDNLERYTQEVRNIMARKPLTNEEILKMWDDTRNDPISPSVFCLIACVRHVERAHGIGEKE